MFKKNPEKEQVWKEKLKSFENSGLSAPKWCAQHQEKVHILKYWRLRLRPSPTSSDFEEIPQGGIANEPIKLTCKTLSVELPLADQKAFIATLERLLKC